MKGEANHKAKLTENDVLLILELYYVAGLSLRVIAGKMDVSKSQIHKIVTRKRWKHVPTAFGHEYTE